MLSLKIKAILHLPSLLYILNRSHLIPFSSSIKNLLQPLFQSVPGMGLVPLEQDSVEDGEPSSRKQPLLLQKDEAAESSRTGGGSGSIPVVLLSTAVATAGSFQFGACLGYSSPSEAGIRKDIGLSLAEYSVFGSILTIGAMVGAATSGHIADWLGRKGAMGISAIICTIGCLAVYFAENALMLYFGRVSSGYGIGVISFVVPVFIAEIAPKNLRGGLTTLNMLLMCCGNSVAYIVGTFVTWRTLVLLGLIPCFVLFVGIFFIPESPRWLAKMGHHREFVSALQSLRGNDADISQESAEIQESIKDLQILPKAKFQDLFESRYIRPFIVSIGLMLLQQLGGISGIGFYASEIFVSAGFASGNIGSILMATIQVPITTFSAILMDKSGRRTLLMVSASGTSIGCFLVAVSFFLKGQEMYSELVPGLALSGILVFIGAFSIGMGGVPWVILSEIFPIKIKGIAGSLVALIHWFGIWAVTYAFNFLASWSSPGTFLIFSVASAATVLFVARMVPETKGRTLEEIQELMISDRLR